jgi:citrate lyase beta subunit
MHSRRALLYIPGDDWKKTTKALTLGMDCICMDMEDGVAPNRKAEARCKSCSGSSSAGNWRSPSQIKSTSCISFQEVLLVPTF